jgi:hypothetical protein
VLLADGGSYAVRMSGAPIELLALHDPYPGVIRASDSPEAFGG